MGCPIACSGPGPHGGRRGAGVSKLHQVSCWDWDLFGGPCGIIRALWVWSVDFGQGRPPGALQRAGEGPTRAQAHLMGERSYWKCLPLLTQASLPEGLFSSKSPPRSPGS
jgi:hypothetical protein